MRKKIVAGNWKMNKNLDETKVLIKEIKKKIKLSRLHNTRVLIAPTTVNLRNAVKKTTKSKIEVIAQNVHQEQSGAFTGEISTNMLKNIGIKTVLIGHSERREYCNENNAILTKKVSRAINDGLEVIYCFGEKLEERESKNHFKTIENQIKEVLFTLNKKDFKQIILAYEPVWAIGTGVTASADQVQEIHSFVRNLIAEKYDLKTADNISILYGGSVKPKNASEIFSKPDVDGGLIGGASLNADDFTAIIKAI